MAETYAELLKKDFARQIKFNHIEDYHKMGFKGKGITILNAEGASDHREMTSGVIKDYAPEMTILESVISIITNGDKVIEATVTINGERIDFEEAINKYHIKIVTRSYAGSSSVATLNYFKDIQKRKGVIFINSAGNKGYDNGIWSKNNTAIAISACKLYEDGRIKIIYYGSVGEIDFTCFMAKGLGTSAASPAMASGIVGLLLQRYGDFNQEECVEILKSLCIDIGDIHQGWGLPILPLTEKLEILENNKMKFKDVEETRWSKEAIDKCVESGLLVGFEDETFRPTECITREQFAQILVRILEKIEGI